MNGSCSSLPVRCSAAGRAASLRVRSSSRDGHVSTVVVFMDNRPEAPALAAAPRTFDHSRMADLPEYHAARKAMSDLANAADGLALDEVRDMATTMYAGDHCPCCQDRFMAEDDFDPTCWPHKATVEGETMRGIYRCPRTSQTWTVSYTADPEATDQLP